MNFYCYYFISQSNVDNIAKISAIFVNIVIFSAKPKYRWENIAIFSARENIAIFSARENIAIFPKYRQYFGKISRDDAIYRRETIENICTGYKIQILVFYESFSFLIAREGRGELCSCCQGVFERPIAIIATNNKDFVDLSFKNNETISFLPLTGMFQINPYFNEFFVSFRIVLAFLFAYNHFAWFFLPFEKIFLPMSKCKSFKFLSFQVFSIFGEQTPFFFSS